MTEADGARRRARFFARRPNTAAGVAALEGLQSLSEAVHEADVLALQTLGLRSTDAMALQHVVNADGDGRTVNATQLAGLLRLTTAGITKLVDRLVRDGRAERRRNPVDRRGVVIAPTESARDDLARAYGHIHGPVVDVIDGLTETEAEAVRRFAQRLAASLRQGSAAAEPSSALDTGPTRLHDAGEADPLAV
jgi:DNA-binding MarR family transcriptional regulator